MKKTAIILASLLIAACATPPKEVPPQASKPVESTAPTEVSTATVSTAEIEARKLADEIQALQKQSIYFDFDKFSIKPEYRNVIQKQAKFLKDHKNDIVTIEGNADERGSSEYNLALGDKRASAAQRDLELLGVSTTQIKTVSLGEEKPRLTCHEEKCWQENRRDDFIHMLSQ